MDTKLKPCPFCGGEGEFRKSNDIPPCIKVYHTCPRTRTSPPRIIIETKWCKTMSDAAELWNRRAKCEKITFKTLNLQKIRKNGE
jgi:hypothetical protein